MATTEITNEKKCEYCEINFLDLFDPPFIKESLYLLSLPERAFLNDIFFWSVHLSVSNFFTLTIFCLLKNSWTNFNQTSCKTFLWNCSENATLLQGE